VDLAFQDTHLVAQDCQFHVVGPTAPARGVGRQNSIAALTWDRASAKDALPLRPAPQADRLGQGATARLVGKATAGRTRRLRRCQGR
jgi:hypothetical protein